MTSPFVRKPLCKDEYVTVSGHYSNLFYAMSNRTNPDIPQTAPVFFAVFLFAVQEIMRALGHILEWVEPILRCITKNEEVGV